MCRSSRSAASRRCSRRRLSEVAARLGATPMQVALAWLLHRAPNILLIPGTSSLGHLRENLAAAELALPQDARGRARRDRQQRPPIGHDSGISREGWIGLNEGPRCKLEPRGEALLPRQAPATPPLRRTAAFIKRTYPLSARCRGARGFAHDPSKSVRFCRNLRSSDCGR